jgi:hypothetical protein
MAGKFLGYQNHPKGSKCGRSLELIRLRNECLIARYYFLSEIKRVRFDDVTAKLSCAFFLSVSRVMAIISSHTALFDEMKGSTARQLAKRWPDYNWD